MYFFPSVHPAKLPESVISATNQLRAAISVAVGVALLRSVEGGLIKLEIELIKLRLNMNVFRPWSFLENLFLIFFFHKIFPTDPAMKGLAQSFLVCGDNAVTLSPNCTSALSARPAGFQWRLQEAVLTHMM